MNIVHHTDVGGSRPGSQGVEGIFDYFQEGLRIPPTKVWTEYQEEAGVVGIIAANTRTPDKVLGDLRAQRSALRVGELRLIELVERYGHATVMAAMDEIITRTEASIRSAIRAIPDGVYPFEDFLDDWGPGTDPLRVAVTVTVAGDGITIDYEGSSPQTASGMNSYINYTRSYSYAAVKCLTDPLGPMNEGALRPVTVKAPEGSFLNPRPPAGGGPRAIICYRTFEAVLGALAAGAARPRGRRRLALRQPDLRRLGPRAQAPLRRLRARAVGHRRPRRTRRVRGDVVGVQRLEHPGGGAGGRPADRRSSASASSPTRPAPARFRGGCGIRRDMRFLADEGKLTNLSERQRFAPYGVFGGKPGRLARTVINPGPGEETVHGKQSREFAYGDVISFQQSGAGGYGDPLERDPARVLDDVLDDYVSIDAARDEYGVVIIGAGADLRVDEPATTRCAGPEAGVIAFTARAGGVPPDGRPVRRRRGGAAGRGDRRAGRVPARGVQAAGRAGLARPALPRGVRRRGCGHGDVLPVRRGAGARLALGGGGGGHAVAHGDVLRLQVRLRGAAHPLPHAGAARRSGRDLRADRAERRLRRGEHHHAAPSVAAIAGCCAGPRRGSPARRWPTC